jgi:FkbM family methyltransferase
MTLDRLDKIHRDGVDVETAFSSELKRAGAEGAATASHGEPRRFGAAVDELSGRPRRWMASAVRALSSRLKIALRPSVVRIRHFMLAPIEEELRQTRQRMDEIGQYAGRVAIPVGDWDVLLRTNAGYVLCSATDYLVLASLIDGGDLERGTRLLIERLVRPGDVVVDVGAHLGLHTLAAGRALRGRGRVHAFEPFEPSVRRLRQSVLINGLADVVEVHEAAAYSHAGTEPLHLGSVSGHHSLFPLSDASGDETVDVSLVRLDDVLAGDGPVSLMKIDVEGAELEAIEGARAILERSPEVGVIVEFGPAHLARIGTSTNAWFDRFEQLGLTFRAIDRETGRLRPLSVARLEEADSTNLLFARPDARIWVRAQSG